MVHWQGLQYKPWLFYRVLKSGLSCGLQWWKGVHGNCYPMKSSTLQVLYNHLNSASHHIVTLIYKQRLGSTVNMGTHAYINTMKYAITHIYNSHMTSLEMKFTHVHKKKQKTSKQSLFHFEHFFIEWPKKTCALGQTSVWRVRKLWTTGTWTGTNSVQVCIHLWKIAINRIEGYPPKASIQHQFREPQHLHSSHYNRLILYNII